MKLGNIKVVSRDEWGEGLDLQRGWKRFKESPVSVLCEGIVLHHFEPDANYNCCDYSVCRERVRHWFHNHTEKWSDIGYHFLIGTEGTVFQGREWVNGGPIRGAHAFKNNENSLGVALLGNYVDEAPTQESLNSLSQLLGQLSYMFDISPKKLRAWNYVALSGETKVVKRPSLVGHRDIRETECPGSQLYALLENMRNDLA